MPRERDIKQLLTRLASNTGGFPHQEISGPIEERQKKEIAPYKKHDSFPGHHFLLIGNSFNVEIKPNSKEQRKRAETLTQLFEKSTDENSCVNLQEAFRHSHFAEILSRFEWDWLSKLPSTTLLGPAYDAKGKLQPQAFSVWRPKGSPTPINTPVRQLVGAVAGNNAHPAPSSYSAKGPFMELGPNGKKAKVDTTSTTRRSPKPRRPN
jgi:hypothetical protein